MKLNKMTSYAIRVISRIAAEEEGRVTSKTIHEKEQIPHGVLMKVLRMLRQAGLIESHQGRGGMSGGFSIAESGSGISVYQIIRAMEGGVDLYPLTDEEAYSGSISEIYERLREINEDYILRLDGVYVGEDRQG